MYLKGRKYAEWIKYSTPIAERQAACADAQPDMENCSNGIAPQPNTLTEGAQKMKVPIVRSMTKYLFDHYRLSMYSYLNNSLRRSQLERLVGFSFMNLSLIHI